MCRERLLILVPKQFNLIPEDKRKDNSPWNPYEIDMKELKGKRIITTKPGQKLYEDIKNIANKFELTHNDLIEIGNMNSLLRLADSGHGVGIIPELYIKSGPHFENIDYCYCSDSLFWWDVAAYYRQELISPAARFLIKSICECMK
jgi:DNA-binding transcriptional LysR family regulator